MNIETVMAKPTGDFRVVFDGQEPQDVSLEENSEKSGALSDWFKAGNRATAWEMSAEELEALAALRTRNQIRNRITANAGDTLSLLGTTSDAATIAVLVSACFMAALDEKTGYKEFRAKANAMMAGISGDHDPTEIAQAFLANVASGAIRLPALEKGIVEVLAEVTERGTAVAEAIHPSE